MHSPSEERGGTGLGLAVVSKAVRQLGGSLLVSSPGPGHGTCCSFVLELECAKLEEKEKDEGEEGAEERPVRAPPAARVASC